MRRGSRAKKARVRGWISGDVFRRGMTKQAEQFVGTVAAEDVCRIETVHGGDCLAQFDRLPVRITPQIVGNRLEGLDCLGAGAERRFVGRKLVDAGNARRMQHRVSGSILCPLAQPKKAIGLEPHIG